jgi:hypothetical protein
VQEEGVSRQTQKVADENGATCAGSFAEPLAGPGHALACETKNLHGVILTELLAAGEAILSDLCAAQPELSDALAGRILAFDEPPALRQHAGDGRRHHLSWTGECTTVYRG